MARITLARAATAIGLAVSYATCEWTRRLSVVVENEGPAALEDVHVFVTGDSAVVGRIDPGERARVRVQPTGDSHVEIGVGSTRGERLVADTYLMRGSTGTVRIVVDGDSVAVVQHAKP
jgi:hypothetical protein